jgi:hypothetical protein
MFKKAHNFAHHLGSDYFLPILTAVISRRDPGKGSAPKNSSPGNPCVKIIFRFLSAQMRLPAS